MEFILENWARSRGVTTGKDILRELQKDDGCPSFRRYLSNLEANGYQPDYLGSKGTVAFLDNFARGTYKFDFVMAYKDKAIDALRAMKELDPKCDADVVEPAEDLTTSARFCVVVLDDAFKASRAQQEAGEAFVKFLRQRLGEHNQQLGQMETPDPDALEKALTCAKELDHSANAHKS
jgi:hypothetical protein